MPGKLYEYLPLAVANYTDLTLNIPPTEDFDDRGKRATRINRTGGGKVVEVIILGAATSFPVPLRWENLYEDEADFIVDFYLDPNKGAFGSRTFPWLHPLDGHTYVVRMTTEPVRTSRGGGLYNVSAVIEVEGRTT